MRQIYDQGPPDSAYGLWYYPTINRFVDEDGHILHDFHDLFDVWQLDEWKKTRKYGLLVDRNGMLCELYYLEPETEEHILSHAWLCIDEHDSLEAWQAAINMETERSSYHEQSRNFYP